MPTADVENSNDKNKGDLLLANKQKERIERIPQGYKRNRRTTNTLTYTFSRRAKRDEKNLAISWIDYKKAYDIILQSWIIECLKMYKISGEIIKFIDNTMENWRVELTVGWKSLA